MTMGSGILSAFAIQTGLGCFVKIVSIMQFFCISPFFINEDITMDTTRESVLLHAFKVTGSYL